MESESTTREDVIEDGVTPSGASQEEVESELESDEDATGSVRCPADHRTRLDRTKFRASFAADVSADAAAFMADSQVPWGLEALNGAVTEPAWKTKPSWHTAGSSIENRRTVLGGQGSLRHRHIPDQDGRDLTIIDLAKHPRMFFTDRVASATPFAALAMRSATARGCDT